MSQNQIHVLSDQSLLSLYIYVLVHYPDLLICFFAVYKVMTKCAAANAYGIIRNHLFFDGNKRTGFITAVTFLLLNDHYIECSEVEVVLTFISLAGGELAEEVLEEWFEKVTVPNTQS